MRALTAVAIVALAVTAGAADAASRHMINGMNVLEPITAVGTEPFWSVNIQGRTVTWSDPEVEFRAGTVGKPKLTRGRIQWKGRVDGIGPFTMTLKSDDCSDGMSDFSYPLAATIKAPNLTLQGCASTMAAFARRDAENRDEGPIR